MSTNAMKLALDYLNDHQMGNHVRAALEEALAKQEQPFAHEAALYSNDRIKVDPITGNVTIGTVKQEQGEPQQRKPLTEEQLIDLWPSLIMHQHTYAFARAIEAAHGIK
jgi:hypothetical protein